MAQMPNQYQTALAAGVGALLEKPIEVKALLETMGGLLAESKEARLRRMCGYQQDTRYFRPPNAGGAGKLRPLAFRSRKPSGPPGERTMKED
jgi:hypothetical protein